MGGGDKGDGCGWGDGLEEEEYEDNLDVENLCTGNKRRE